MLPGQWMLSRPVVKCRIRVSSLVWFYHAVPKAQGLLWTSRRDDEAKAMVLFGDRIRARAFEVRVERESLVGEWRDELLTLAERIGIDMLAGN